MANDFFPPVDEALLGALEYVSTQYGAGVRASCFRVVGKTAFAMLDKTLN
jgi:hypothetical protein